MTVLPASQLTMRMVPASTSRKNAATIIGTTRKTPTSTAPMMTRGLLKRLLNMKHPVGLRESGFSDRAAISVGVDVFDAHGVASANANARVAIRRDQRAKALHH